jgi:uncharacterized protein YbcC (UPF0753/DUF2309 family)
MKKEAIIETVRSLSGEMVKNWPLYSFVTSNPLSGLEEMHFEEAIRDVRKYLNINGYPSAEAFEQAWARRDIDLEILEEQLKKKGLSLSADQSLQRMHEFDNRNKEQAELGDVDRNLIKWITAFLDQGSTEWPMPYREEGFYRSWKKNARYDYSLPKRDQIHGLPDDSMLVLERLLDSVQEADLRAVLKQQLLALPGWTGYIKYRIENDNEWQQAYPITLIDYLAVRLILCSQFGTDFSSKKITSVTDNNEEDDIKSAWLRAMEITYQQKLTRQLTSQSRSLNHENRERPEAQFVFCIDTRSERIRRAIERAGDYETFGYAGFFGVAMEYRHPEKDISNKSCPPIVDVQFEATEVMRPNQKETADTFNFYNTLQNAFTEFSFTLKNNIPASFGYVESAGFFYGFSMLLRTLMPAKAYRLVEKARRTKGYPEWFSKPELSNKVSPGSDHSHQLSIAQKTTIAKTAFELMGWDTFAPVVVFAGHGSQTANNPFGSSLDCGACAGNKGRHNARVLADICNDEEVRTTLANEYDIDIPKDTLFLAAEHNTTSNGIEFFDHHLADTKRDQINEIKHHVDTAQHLANQEQFNISNVTNHQTLEEAQRRTSDWAETRPEWGLAGNASFIIGARTLTSKLNLEARSFLHSYDWRKDPDGKKLESILQGPMVVTQWINNHYYFAAVDNEIFGSGSKITQNVTGKFGVVQGNGGDLKSGLPLESLREDDYQLQHFPLRLSVFIHAPKIRVESIIAKNPDTIAKLVENEWIYLSVVDPTLGNEVIHLNNRAETLEKMHE